MGRTIAQRSAPRFTQINRPYALTDEERRRLAVIRDEYPHVEWLGRRGVDHCRFLRWFWRQDGETNG